MLIFIFCTHIPPLYRFQKQKSIVSLIPTTMRILICFLGVTQIITRQRIDMRCCRAYSRSFSSTFILYHIFLCLSILMVQISNFDLLGDLGRASPKAPLCKGSSRRSRVRDCDRKISLQNNPSVAHSRATSLCTREALF